MDLDLVQISFDSLVQLDLNFIGLAYFDLIMALVKIKSISIFRCTICSYNFIILQKTNSCIKIQLNTKLIIQHYAKTNYKIHELTQNKYDNCFLIMISIYKIKLLSVDMRLGMFGLWLWCLCVVGLGWGNGSLGLDFFLVVVSFFLKIIYGGGCSLWWWLVALYYFTRLFILLILCVVAIIEDEI